MGPAVDMQPTESLRSTSAGGAGKMLVMTGLLVLGFVGYQNVGTAVTEARAQSALRSEYEMGLLPTSLPQSTSERAPSSNGTPVGHTDQPDRPRPTAAVEVGAGEGDAIAVLRIPSIDLDKVVVEGTERSSLATGPGRYSETAPIGGSGNTAIAGHRTTFGSPFAAIDRLVPGDEVLLETSAGTFTYEVLPSEVEGSVSGHRIVRPEQVEVLADHGDDRLTLTACHPRYSARERIVVQARLVERPQSDVMLHGVSSAQKAPPFPSTSDIAGLDGGRAEASTRDDSLGWDPGSVVPTIAWAAAAISLGALQRRLIGHGLPGRLRWWVPALSLVVVWQFYGELNRLLPQV